jgi:hypothetical protein
MSGVFVLYRWSSGSTADSFENLSLLKKVIEVAEIQTEGFVYTASGVSEKRLQGEPTPCRIIHVKQLVPKQM